MKKLLLLGFLMLAGCGSTLDVATPVLSPLAPVPVPSVTPLVLNPMQFQVMNSTDIENLAATLEKSKTDNVYFILDENDYKNLLLNLNSINSYIQEQTTVIELLDKINAERATETNVPAK